MLTSVIHLLLVLVVLILIWWAVTMILGQMGAPPIVGQLLSVILALILVVYLLQILFGVAWVPLRGP